MGNRIGVDQNSSQSREQRAQELRELIRADAETFAQRFLDMEELVWALAREVKDLRDQLNKRSDNSSKPPSSDGYNKPAPKSMRERSGKKSGGQAGHQGRTLMQVENPDYVIEYTLEHCPISARALGPEDVIGVIKRQVFELPEPRLEVTEHRAYQYLIDGKVVQAPFPGEVSAPVQYGRAFKSFLVYLHEYQMIPQDRISQFCQDLYGYQISEGTLANAREQCFDQLEDFEQALKERLSHSGVLHSDESGLRVEGKLNWVHSASTSQDTHYHIDRKRGRQGMEAAGILKSFRGTLVHDCWSSYFSWEDCRHALCNAHLLRELRFFEEQGQSWATKMSLLLKEAYRDPGGQALKNWVRQYHDILKSGYAENPTEPTILEPKRRGRVAKPKVINLLDRFSLHRKAILRFLVDSALPFTNNQAEQDIRMVKVKQKINGTFRSLKGAQIFCRIRSYISCARKRQQSVFLSLRNAFFQNPDFCSNPT